MKKYFSYLTFRVSWRNWTNFVIFCRQLHHHLSLFNQSIISRLPSYMLTDHTLPFMWFWYLICSFFVHCRFCVALYVLLMNLVSIFAYGRVCIDLSCRRAAICPIFIFRSDCTPHHAKPHEITRDHRSSISRQGHGDNIQGHIRHQRRPLIGLAVCMGMFEWNIINSRYWGIVY